MLATTVYMLRRMLIAIGAWSFVLAGFGVLNVVGFEHIIRESLGPLLELMESLPAPLKALAGEPQDFITPAGFLHAKYFLMAPLLLGVYAVFAASGLLVTDEEKGRLDLLAGYPVSRASLFWGRVTALIAALAIILAAAWGGLAGAVLATGVDLNVGRLALACLSLLAAVLVFAAAALLFSFLLPSRIYAASAAGLLLLVSVMVVNLAPTMSFLEPAAAVLPLHFYQGGKAMTEFAFAPLAVLLLMTAIQLGAACWLFERRDIRVIGEGVLNLRQVSLGAAVWLVVYAALIGGAAGLSRPRTSYDSPQEVFAAVKESLAKRQWEQFVGCLTPESRDRWTGMLVALGTFLQADELGAGSQPPSETQQSAGGSDELFRSLGKATVGLKTAMQHIDREQVKSLRGEIDQALASRTQLSDKTLQRLAGAVDDRDAFLIEALSALSGLMQFDLDVSLTELKVNGDTATGEMQLPFGMRQTVEFRRTGSGWLIDLPLVHGLTDTPPTAFFHGRRDVIVSLDGPMSPKPMFLKVKQLGVATQLTVLADADHISAMHAPEGLRAMWAFFEQEFEALSEKP